MGKIENDLVKKGEVLGAALEAIETVRLGFPENGYATGLLRTAYELIIKKVRALLPAELREWTPIKEGPPKKFGQYLVTITPAAGELWSKVEIAHYSDLMGIAKPGFWTGNVGKNDFEDLTELVTAWAPCPEPYKKEGGE